MDDFNFTVMADPENQVQLICSFDQTMVIVTSSKRHHSQTKPYKQQQ